MSPDTHSTPDMTFPWSNQVENTCQPSPAVNNSPHFDPPLNFKLKSRFWLTNLNKMKCDCILGKLSPITYVPIVDFMQSLQKTPQNNSEYNKTSPLWLIIVITVCSILVVSPLIFMFVSLRCAKLYSQCAAWYRKRKPKDDSTTEMVPMTPPPNHILTHGSREHHKQEALTQQPMKSIYWKHVVTFQWACFKELAHLSCLPPMLWPHSRTLFHLEIPSQGTTALQCANDT